MQSGHKPSLVEPEPLPVLGWLGEAVASSSPTAARLKGMLAEVAAELA